MRETAGHWRQRCGHTCRDRLRTHTRTCKARTTTSNGGKPMKILRRVALAAGLALLSVAQPANAQGGPQTTIRMWTFLNPAGTSPREVALADIIAQFERANPDIKIAVEPQVWDQMSPKFLAAARAGN